MSIGVIEMVLIAEEVIQQVKDNVNIVELIDQFVALKKRGKNHFGYCPFHDERTPSFSVSEEKQIYKCFSCGRAGNVFSFFMEKDHLTFPEAVKYVAELGHVPVTIALEHQEVEKSDQQRALDQLIKMHQLAAEFYHHVLLHTTEGEEALNYLKKRGFTQDVIETFKMGVALSKPDLLINLLQNKGFSSELIRQSGLASSYEERLLDRFRDRIMFPLRNERGEYVAFSGRIYKDTLTQTSDDTYKEAKYLNSPETRLFNKGSFIFNLDLARPTIRQRSEFMLCEGFMDVISTWQAGITYSVASMGTSLTEEQIHRLRRMASKVLIAFDGDLPGQKATDRAIRMLRQVNDMTINVLPMLDNMDPDEMIQLRGATYFLEYVNHQQETDFAFYRRFYAQQFTLDTQRSQLDYIDSVLKELLFVQSIPARSMYLQELSEEFHIPLLALEQQLQLFNQATKTEKKVSRHQVIQSPVNVLPTKKTQRQLAEEQLLKRLLTKEETQHLLLDNQQDLVFSTMADQTIYLLLTAFRQKYGTEISAFEFVDTLVEVDLRNRVMQLLSDDFDNELTDNEIMDLLSVMNKDNVRHEIQLKRQALAQAELEKNSEQITQLMTELQELTKKLK